MSFFLYFLAVLVLVILWGLRPLIATGLGIVAFYFADLLHKKEAHKIIQVFNKLDDDEAITAVKMYRRKFVGLKLFGLVLLLGYSYISAIIVYLIIHWWPLFYIVFFGTIIINWSFYITNIGIRYLIFHGAREDGFKLKDLVQ